MVSLSHATGWASEADYSFLFSIGDHPLLLDFALDVVFSSRNKNVEVHAGLMASDSGEVFHVRGNDQETPWNQFRDLGANCKLGFSLHDIDDLLIGVRVRLGLVSGLQGIQGERASFCVKDLSLDARSDQFPFHLFPIHRIQMNHMALLRKRFLKA